MRYTIEKPERSISIYALAVVVCMGLAALFIAAFFAFSEVMPWYQALFAAVLIEAGAIVEALAFAKDNNRIAFMGLAISLIVSMTYNYIQASQAGHANGITNWWQLLTLAVGPLTALTFLSLALGRELKHHASLVSQWEADRQAWMEQKEAERKAEAEKERIRQERREAKLRRETARISDVSGVDAVTDFRHLPEEMLPEIAAMSPREIADKFPLIAPRTARDWPRRAKEAINQPSVRAQSSDGQHEPVNTGQGRE